MKYATNGNIIVKNDTLTITELLLEHGMNHTLCSWRNV